MNIDKKKLLEYMYHRCIALEELSEEHTGYHKRHLTGQHTALKRLAGMIQQGMFDVEPFGNTE